MAYVNKSDIYKLFDESNGVIKLHIADVDMLPTADVVEVVRCKDCKYYSAVKHNGEPMHYGYCYNTHDDVLGSRHRYEGDFCSYGERRTDNDL